MTTHSYPGTDSNEIEWQFEADDLDRVERWLRGQPRTAALRFVPAKDAVQRDAYFDTEAWDFHRAKFSLRVRRSASRSEVTLKALGSSAAGLQTRREISQPLPEGEADIAHQYGPVSERLRLLAADRELRPLFEVETHRRTFRAEEEGVPVAELALDDTRIERDGGVVGHLTRVEVESIGNAARSPLLQSFVAALAEAMELRPANSSKFEVGLECAGLQPEALLSFEKTSASPEDDASDFALSVLRRFFAELVAHEAGTRLGEDPEELHDMRVAVRRLRAALSMFEDALPDEFREIREDLGWLGRSLGEVRDLDVQLMTFQERRASASWSESNALGELIQVLEGSRTEARVNLIETLESERYGALLLRMESALASGAESLAVGVPVRQFVAPILKQRYRRFKDDAEALTPESEPASFHAVRIRGKRLRYSVEFSRPIYGKPAERLAEAVAAVQGLLGDYQDSSVTIEWLRGLTRDRGSTLAPETLLFMGELIGQQRERQRELRLQWPSAFEKVRERWRRLRKDIGRDEPDEALGVTEDADDLGVGVEPSASRFRGGPLALLRRRHHTSY